jgi:hypothetical protein
VLTTGLLRVELRGRKLRYPSDRRLGMDTVDKRKIIDPAMDRTWKATLQKLLKITS